MGLGFMACMWLYYHLATIVEARHWTVYVGFMLMGAGGYRITTMLADTLSRVRR